MFACSLLGIQWALEALRWLQDGPGGPRDGPGGFPYGPKSAQYRPKSSPRNHRELNGGPEGECTALAQLSRGA
eukprot:6315956-Pyramimonas_sp.AAC.1